MVTIEPLKPYVDALLTGVSSSQVLARPGQDAHTMMFAPSQARLLDTAEFIILPDRDMNPTLDRLLTAREAKAVRVVALTALPAADAQPYSDDNRWLSTSDAEPEEMLDPHLWLDPVRMANIAPQLAEQLAARYPMHRAQLMANAKALQTHLLETVHPALKRMLAGAAKPVQSAKPYIPFISYHGAYHYFLERYALVDAGQITQRPENYMGARSLRDVLAQAEKVRIGCILSETNSTLVQRVSKASGATVVALNPERIYTPQETPSLSWLKNDYDRLLYHTADAVAGCSGK